MPVNNDDGGNWLPDSIRALCDHQSYMWAGNHTAVKPCTWTKKSLRGEGVCYKESFYGIRCHMCCQMTPSIGICENRCSYCWRPTEHTINHIMPSPVDDPKKLYDSCIAAHRKALSGFGGNDKVDKERLEQSMNPVHFAISLAGEPTAYPKLSEFVRDLKARNCSTFIVSNGMNPDAIAGLEMPTQFYVSLSAPNAEVHRKVCKPVIKDAWEKYMQTLDLMPKLDTRTAIRVTAMKNHNMTEPDKYAELIERAAPMFVEIKAYMFVGYSRQRNTIEDMPRHHEVVEFSEQIADHCGYKIVDERPESRVTLLMKKDRDDRIMKFD